MFDKLVRVKPKNKFAKNFYSIRKHVFKIIFLKIGF